ncbi:MAG: hypothetical protein AAFV88_11580 [Planctomycetota bacterium]
MISMAKKKKVSRTRSTQTGQRDAYAGRTDRAARKHGEQERHSWDYDDLVRITGKTRNTVYQHVARGSFDPDSLESVVCWIARHANLDLKRKILDYALESRANRNPGL